MLMVMVSQLYFNAEILPAKILHTKAKASGSSFQELIATAQGMAANNCHALV